MKIGFLGDSINYVTAYAKVANGMVKGMQKLGHECVSFSLQWQGAPGMHEGITVYPASDAQSMERGIMEAKADVVISVRDAWVHTQRWYSGPGRTPYNVKAWTSRYGGKAVIYSPVQSDPLPSDYIATVNDASDFFYTMSEYGRKALVDGGAPSAKVGVLYHGVDPNVFRPLVLNAEGRKTYRRKHGLPEEGTMLMFIGLHIDGRKMQPLLMKAFVEYLKQDPSAFLYMHCDPVQFYALDTHAKALGLAGRGKLFLKKDAGVMWGVPDAEINELMNCADVYVSLSSAEGFDYPAAEAAVSGLPLVLTDLPVHRELFGDAPGVRLIPSRKIMPTVWSLDWLADPEAAAGCIAEAVEAGKGQERKQWMPDRFNWGLICAQLDSKLMEVTKK